MVWGSFGSVHIFTLILAAAIIAGIYFALRKAYSKVQTLVLGVLSFSGIAAIIFNLVMWDNPLEYLPLHLCSLNALVLPIAVFTRSKTLGNLLLVWSLGALAALVVNTAQAQFEIFSATFCFYYFPHVLEYGIPNLLFQLGLIKKDCRCIGSTLAITAGAYTLVHLANLALNHLCRVWQLLDPAGKVIQVNYMYSLAPENPLLALFYRLVPHQYWYMYLIVPIVAVYLLGVYAPQLRAALRKRALTV